ncbi:DnaE-like error-prone DNA polymerase [Rhizobium azibense]|uniref:Error-prone DNA polymerase n=1 Tax=Rhizobium azibense TaxID=1136135 RepID=A0A4R3QNM4_9HYPH|nr:error-prone DNA polymerase [Rhizobium azibense]TCU23740.1 DnaE-like error-prone DNA polymerase [Rhizobium azibense]
MSTAPAFFEIGARTNFSFLEGASSPEEMVVQAACLKLGGLGIADKNTVAGVVRAHAQAEEIRKKFERKEAGLLEGDEKKQIIFDPIRLQPGARLVFSDGTPDVLAYPQNRRGWAHLCRLLSAGNLKPEAEKGSCILTETEIMEWGDEMMLAIIPDRLFVDDAVGLQAFENCLQRFRKRFGRTVHMALAPAYDGRDKQVFATLAILAARHRIPLIVTNQPLYHHPDRRPLSDIVVAIRSHVPVAEAGFLLAPNAERYLKGMREMVRLFKDYPGAIDNTRAFFSSLTFSLSELEHNYPPENDPGETPYQTLERLTWAGAAKRYHPEQVPQKIVKQIDYELDLIRQKNYASYFLTVYKIIQHARYKLEVLCQGRGSAANSVICYCLEITEVDPNKATLLFDRFISMDRDEPPDIDVDFEHDRREEVIQYIYKRYGIDHAGLTAGVTTYRTRSAGREVAKAFGLSEDVQSAISSLVWGWSEDNLSERDAKAAGLDIGDPVTKNVLRYASELLGFPRHLTQHVGGFVITRDRLDEVVPIMKTAMPDRYMIEWDKDDLDNVKILKVDILALGMLTCLRKAFQLLQLHYDVKKTLADLGNREHGQEGKPVYEMICRADTLGVFQIESRAQMSMLPRLKPREFYDLVIEVAIVRPGPIQGDMVHPYLKRRQQKTPIEYPSSELKAVLERTLGVPLFQEQAMQIAITAAGFMPAEADRLRRAMATFKRTGTIGNFQKRFIEGMVSRHYSSDFAHQCFNQIKGFGEYGFPESHAASFALLVYASSWIKAYYPDVFCAAMLNSQPMGFYAPAQLVRDAREHGVEIRAVDINRSDWDCLLEDACFDKSKIDFRHKDMHKVIRTKTAVRLGFRQVKGLSGDMIKAKLIANRGAGYSSIRDLWLRSGLEKSQIERLADADAFGSIGLSRREALWAARALDVKSAAERLPLFDRVSHVDLQVEPRVNLPEMLSGEQVVEDYRYLSLSLKGHPISFLREDFQKAGITRNVDLLAVPNGKRVTIAGLVLVRQRPGSAKGVIFMTLEDETGVANAIVWKTAFEKYRSVVMGARLVKIHGKLQSQSGVIHTVVEHIEDMTPALGLLQKEAQRFGLCQGADETMRPTDHSGARKAAGILEKDAMEGPMISVGSGKDAGETAKVMPKGRNFH